MMELDDIIRQSGGRIRSALIRRFNDIEIADDAFSEACLRAARSWSAVPANPSGWLYRAAVHAALDQFRKARTARTVGRTYMAVATATTREDDTGDDIDFEDRLGLLFMCCHPALALDARIALTLRLVCGLSTDEIAAAFSAPAPTIAQRLVRAKRKISEAGIPFGIPGREAWAERVDAVLSVLEIVFGRLNDSAAEQASARLTLDDVEVLCRRLLAAMPEVPEVPALTATVLYCRARRPARIDGKGIMVPLDQQDPRLWDRELIAEAEGLLRLSIRSGLVGARTIEAGIQSAWCSRTSHEAPIPWRDILQLYDTLLLFRDDPVVRLNRCLALCRVAGVGIALAELRRIGRSAWRQARPFHAMGAYLHAEAGDWAAAVAHLDRMLEDPALGLPERRWILSRKRELHRLNVATPASGDSVSG